MIAHQNFHRLFSKFVFRAWPAPFAHVRLMNLLNPPPVEGDLIIKKLRGYPLNIQIDPNSYIGRYVYYRGIFEEQIFNKLRELLKPGMVVVDAGANIGLHTLVSSHLVGTEGRVISIEPQSDVRAILLGNIKRNDLTNVTVFDCALGERTGEGTIFKINPTNNGQSTLALNENEKAIGEEHIVIKPLDELLETAQVSRVDLLKIDVEGSEFEVLKGSQKVIDQNPPTYILMECIDEYLKRFHSSNVEVLNWLTERGYRLHQLHNGRWIPVTGDFSDIGNADILAIHE